MDIVVRGPTLARLAMALVLLSIGNTPALRATTCVRGPSPAGFAMVFVWHTCGKQSTKFAENS